MSEPSTTDATKEVESSSAPSMASQPTQAVNVPPTQSATTPSSSVSEKPDDQSFGPWMIVQRRSRKAASKDAGKGKNVTEKD